MGVLVKLKEHRKIRIPLRTGRIVTFSDNIRTQCIDEKEIRPEFFEVVKKCSETKLEEHESARPGSRDSACKSCHEKGGTMQCDFEENGRTKKCIRCGISVARNISMATCVRRGWGDWIVWLTDKLRLPHCEACSKRRVWLNELDRKFYRWRWERRNANKT